MYPLGRFRPWATLYEGLAGTGPETAAMSVLSVLILGGTRFVGRHLLEVLEARGHRVTLFHRGQNEPDGLPQAEHVHGDRAGDLGRLRDRHFDAVIDTSGYTPDVVGASAAYFHELADRYLFISSVSVYAKPAAADAPLDERSAVETLPAGESTTEMKPQTYGALKALCEDRVRAAFGDRAIVVRPGLIAGPYDPTDRFTYWPVRVRDGGIVLAPPRDAPVQFVDARDLAAFCVRLLETKASGTYNVTGPRGALTIGDVLESCDRASRAGARFVWATEAFLDANEVAPWMELPLWIPQGEMRYIVQADVSRALAAGLEVRALDRTVADTLAWARVKKREELTAGMKADREAELLTRFSKAGAPPSPAAETPRA